MVLKYLDFEVSERDRHGHRTIFIEAVFQKRGGGEELLIRCRYGSKSISNGLPIWKLWAYKMFGTEWKTVPINVQAIKEMMVDNLPDNVSDVAKFVCRDFFSRCPEGM